jgi:hypothetical protein
LGLVADFELGGWSVDRLQRLLDEMWGVAGGGPGDRLVFVARALRRTPFEFESRLPIPARGHIRFRLQSLDCITYIYLALALAHARTVAAAVTNLCNIRYDGGTDRTPDSDPAAGNIFDFAYESLIVNCVRRGLLQVVTGDVNGQDGDLVTVRGRLEPFRRHPAYDPEERLVTPKLTALDIELQTIAKANFPRLTGPQLRRGDLVLLIKQGPRAVSGLIGHVIIADPHEAGMHFLHSSRNFAWLPDATRSDPPRHAGVYYEDDPRKEQLGVEYGTLHAGDHLALSIEGLPYHGYSSTERREMHDYAANVFDFAMILRPV